MMFSNYFSCVLSPLLELCAASLVQSNWSEEEAYLAILPSRERARFRVLLTALRELPEEIQRSLAHEVLRQVAVETDV